MKQIDRLIREARKLVKPSIYSAFCIIDRDYKTGKWKAEPQLWDGVPGSGYIDSAIPADWKTEYGTADEAAEAVNALFESLNISDPNRVVILIDDMGG